KHSFSSLFIPLIIVVARQFSFILGLPTPAYCHFPSFFIYKSSPLYATSLMMAEGLEISVHHLPYIASLFVLNAIANPPDCFILMVTLFGKLEYFLIFTRKYGLSVGIIFPTIVKSVAGVYFIFL